MDFRHKKKTELTVLKLFLGMKFNYAFSAKKPLIFSGYYYSQALSALV